MQDKQKVTLYLPPELHRKLKIRAAVDAEPMSEIAKRALMFYLEHSEVVEEFEGASGRTHRVYNCPDCETSMVMREGEMVAVRERPAIIDDELPVDAVSSVDATPDRPGEELVLTP